MSTKIHDLVSCGVSRLASLLGAHGECLSDRARYKAFCPNVIRLVWQSLCTTVLSRKVREEVQIDDGTFTTLLKTRLEAEYKRLDVISQLAMDEDVAKIKELLRGRIRDLKEIFQFYAAAEQGGDANTMDSTEYKKFVRETKLQKDRKKLPSYRVDLIFQACCIDQTKSGRARVEDTVEELDGNKFVESLARISSYKYEGKGGGAGSSGGIICPMLRHMLVNDILPNACSVDLQVFRDRMESDAVKGVFSEHRHNLGVVFGSYAGEDVSSDDAVSKSGTMNVGELVSFGRGFSLIGAPPLLSERAVKVLFAYVQQEDPDASDEEGEAVVDDDNEMVISEFREALAAIGGQLYPDPYNVFDMKVSMFLKNQIVKVAAAMLRFRKLGGPPKGLKPIRRSSKSGENAD